MKKIVFFIFSFLAIIYNVNIIAEPINRTGISQSKIAEQKHFEEQKQQQLEAQKKSEVKNLEEQKRIEEIQQANEKARIDLDEAVAARKKAEAAYEQIKKEKGKEEIVNENLQIARDQEGRAREMFDYTKREKEIAEKALEIYNQFETGEVPENFDLWPISDSFKFVKENSVFQKLLVKLDEKLNDLLKTKNLPENFNGVAWDKLSEFIYFLLYKLPRNFETMNYYQQEILEKKFFDITKKFLKENPRTQNAIKILDYLKKSTDELEKTVIFKNQEKLDLKESLEHFISNLLTPLEFFMETAYQDVIQKQKTDLEQTREKIQKELSELYDLQKIQEIAKETFEDTHNLTEEDLKKKQEEIKNQEEIHNANEKEITQKQKEIDNINKNLNELVQNKEIKSELTEEKLKGLIKDLGEELEKIIITPRDRTILIKGDLASKANALARIFDNFLVESNKLDINQPDQAIKSEKLDKFMQEIILNIDENVLKIMKLNQMDSLFKTFDKVADLEVKVSLGRKILNMLKLIFSSVIPEKITDLVKNWISFLKKLFNKTMPLEMVSFDKRVRFFLSPNEFNELSHEDFNKKLKDADKYLTPYEKTLFLKNLTLFIKEKPLEFLNKIYDSSSIIIYDLPYPKLLAEVMLSGENYKQQPLMNIIKAINKVSVYKVFPEISINELFKELNKRAKGYEQKLKIIFINFFDTLNNGLNIEQKMEQIAYDPNSLQRLKLEYKQAQEIAEKLMKNLAWKDILKNLLKNEKIWDLEELSKFPIENGKLFSESDQKAFSQILKAKKNSLEQ